MRTTILLLLLGAAAFGQQPMALQQFEELALAGNPTLAQADALVRESAGLARQAALPPNPTIGYQGEQIRGGAFGGGEQGAFVQQTFVLGGKLALRGKVYEQQRRADEIGAGEQRYRVLGDIRQQFYAALAAQEMAHLRERLQQTALDAVETAHQLANVGQADLPDVLQSEAEAEKAKLDTMGAQRMFRREFAMLAALAGHAELAPCPLLGNLEDVPALDAEQAAAEIERNSPRVKRAEQDVARAEAALKSAERERIPDLQVRAGFQNNLERLNEMGARDAGVQAFVSAGVSVPLFNRNQGNVAAARADLERAQAEVNRVRLAIRRSTQPVAEDCLTARAYVERYKNEIIPRAERAYRLYLGKYKEMGAAYPQVLASQRTLFQLQVAYAGALAQLWSDTIALRNFMLADGLSAPQPATGGVMNLNLPAGGGGQ